MASLGIPWMCYREIPDQFLLYPRAVVMSLPHVNNIADIEVMAPSDGLFPLLKLHLRIRVQFYKKIASMQSITFYTLESNSIFTKMTPHLQKRIFSHSLPQQRCLT